MTGQLAELLPIVTTNDEGSTVYLCGVCKKPCEFDSVARFCAQVDAALLESVPTFSGRAPEESPA